MNNFLKKYFGGDFVIWVVFFALCVVSIIEMYSASSQLIYDDDLSDRFVTPIMQHAFFLIVGIAVAFGIHRIPVKVIRLLAYIGLLLSFVFLIYALFAGIETNDAKRWVSFLGIRFQPSELAKLSLVIFTADILSRIKNYEQDEKKIFWWLMGISGVICALIFVENFSTALLLFLIIMIMCIIQKIYWKRTGTVILSLLSVVAIIFIVAWNVPHILPEQLDRAKTWVNRIKGFPEDEQNLHGKNVKRYTDYITQKGDTLQYLNYQYVYDVNSKGDSVLYEMYNAEIRYKNSKGTRKIRNITNEQPMNSLIAIARGVPGKFPGNSIQRDYLSMPYSDYIYAIIIEETGIFGAVVVILLYLVLLFRAGRIATRSTQVFPAMLVIGISLIIVIQALIHMLVVTGIGPVTGQPLPLISRGGTSTIITCVYFGIILGVTRQMKEEEQKQNELTAQDDDMKEVKLDEL